MALTQLKTGAIADDAVTTDKLANAINTERTANTAKTSLENDSVTLAKMAGGTDGQIITYDASGDPVAVGPGTDGQVLTSTGAGSPPAFEAIPASGRAYNLIVNGAMNVAQRGTSSTSSGYYTIDRFKTTFAGTDEAPTFAQVDVASGTTPYTSGFRKCLKVTNGNQTSGAGAADNILISYSIEAQDLATSGWNYTSSSSDVTLSFWVKSSVAQDFHGFLLTDDGSSQLYSFSTGSLSADTWTKVTKTISGNSNLTFNTDNGEGILLRLGCFQGTDKTGTLTQNQWAAVNTSVMFPNFTSTWYTTNDATLEITGVLLEVGNSASDYPHESYADTLAKCQRYFYEHLPDGGNNDPIASGTMSYAVRGIIQFPVRMRTDPSIVASNFTDAYYFSAGSSSNFFDTIILSNVSNPSDGWGVLFGAESTSAKLGFSAEL